MTTRKTALAWWIAGLLALGVVALMNGPLDIEGVKGGMTAHQKAGSAKAVEDIHELWIEADLYEWAQAAIVTDLVFIAICSIGTYLMGRQFRASGSGIVRMAGLFALATGLVFMLTDYAETIAQAIQLFEREGSDRLAAIAATVRPVKMAAWIAAFLAVLAGLVMERQARQIA